MTQEKEFTDPQTGEVFTASEIVNKYSGTRADLARPLMSPEEWKEYEADRKVMLDAVITEKHKVYKDKGNRECEKKDAVTTLIKTAGYQEAARAFGLSWEILPGIRTIGQDSKGEYYTWQYPVHVTAPNGYSMTSIGACSSRKPFFSTKGGQRIDPQEENIALNAQTTGLNRAIGYVLGIDDYAEEEFYGKTRERPPQSQGKPPAGGKPEPDKIQKALDAMRQELEKHLAATVFNDAERKAYRKRGFEIKDVSAMNKLLADVRTEKTDREKVLNAEASGKG